MVILTLTMDDDNVKKLVKLQTNNKSTLSKHIPWEGLRHMYYIYCGSACKLYYCQVICATSFGIEGTR